MRFGEVMQKSLQRDHLPRQNAPDCRSTMKPARSPESHRSILKVLVGSHAHGLAGHESDQDFRSVFVIPTKAMFRVGFKYQGARMMKEGEDETAWEIGQFLFLAQQGHPLVLETFMAPVVETDTWGAELRDLFPSPLVGPQCL